MRIKTIELKNFRGFETLSLELHPRLNVIAGANGCGKSSIIDASAILLSRLFSSIAKIGIRRVRADRYLDILDIKNGATSASGRISIEYADREIAWTVYKRRDITKKEKNIYVTRILQDIDDLIEHFQDSLIEDDDFSIPIAVLYGTNRLVQDIPIRIKTRHEFHQLSAIDQALSGARIEFRSFFEWFRNQEDIENQEIRKNGSNFRDRNLTAVRAAVGELVGFPDITINRNPLRMDVRKGNSYFDIRQMSDGEKCFIALVGDLARRLAMANPGLKNPLEGRGIVLIDEIELHLHPAWQRKAISGLQKLFPNCQFILTTHSPQVLGECLRESIVLLKCDEAGNHSIGNPPHSFGMDSSLILESLMDAPSRNPGIAKKIDEIYSLIDKEDVAGAKRKIQALRKKIDGDLPDLVGAETAMTWLED